MKNPNENEQDKKLPVLPFKINGVKYEWSKQYITGAEIRQLGNIPTSDKVYLLIKRPWEDEEIADDKEVNLARPEIEEFYSGKRKFTLLVNAKQESWEKEIISFKELVILAFGSYDENPNKIYTVCYDRGPKENPEGTMVRDESVHVKNGMKFDVKPTDKS